MQSIDASSMIKTEKRCLSYLTNGPSFILAKSLWPSLIPVISPCSQSQGRKRFPVDRIVVRKHSPPATFPANFSARTFPTTLPPRGSPDADQPPFLPVSAIRALHVPLLGFFCFRGPSDQFFRHPPANFSQLQSLHVPWEVFFYLSGP
ncbi:hypothetical protein AAG906_015239 [Vitis piasezkii]